MDHLMEIRLEVKHNSPLSIADALIDNENSIAVELHSRIVARERIRQIGMALLNYVDSDIAIEKYMAERCEHEG